VYPSADGECRKQAKLPVGAGSFMLSPAREKGCPVSTTSALPTAQTFVIRIWRETGGKALQWRGRIEHVQSRENCGFVRLEEMIEFLGRFGLLEQDQSMQGQQ
jgi:hypothetical protein